MEEKNRYGRKIKALNRAFHQAANASFADMELTCTQGMLLAYLARHKEETVFPKDLEQFFELSHPTVSGLLNRLEAKGFITVTPDLQDRRCKRIAMTEKAVQARERTAAQMAALDLQLVSGFTEQEANQFWQLLCRAADNVAEKEEHHD